VSLHQTRTHQTPVPGCFACKVSGVQIAPSATPSRRAGSNVAALNGWERRLGEDMPAYKRLRQAGMQPKGIAGAADVERRAETKYEVESGNIMPGQARRIEEASRELRESGFAKGTT
jgi:hypothetical protein